MIKSSQQFCFPASSPNLFESSLARWAAVFGFARAQSPTVGCKISAGQCMTAICVMKLLKKWTHLTARCYQGQHNVSNKILTRNVFPTPTCRPIFSQNPTGCFSWGKIGQEVKHFISYRSLPSISPGAYKRKIAFLPWVFCPIDKHLGLSMENAFFAWKLCQRCSECAN